MSTFGSTQTDERELNEMEKILRDIRINNLNINSLIETLKHHGKILDQLSDRQDVLEKHFMTLNGRVDQLQNTIRAALVEKFGSGPTA